VRTGERGRGGEGAAERPVVWLGQCVDALVVFADALACDAALCACPTSLCPSPCESLGCMAVSACRSLPARGARSPEREQREREGDING
jgi:hypothetical protein